MGSSFSKVEIGSPYTSYRETRKGCMSKRSGIEPAATPAVAMYTTGTDTLTALGVATPTNIRRPEA